MTQLTMADGAVGSPVQRAVSIPLALQIDDAELRRIVTRAADALYFFDERGRLLEISGQGHQTLGYLPGEMANLSIFDLDVDLDSAELEDLFRQIEHDKPLVRECRYRRKDGTLIPVEVRMGSVRIAGHSRTVLAAARDIGERKQVEEQLALALLKTQESDRMKSVFLQTVSHEIRTPLNVIVGYNSLVLDAASGNAGTATQPVLEGIERATKRLLEAVHSALDLSKIETASFKIRPLTIELALCLDGVLADFADDARRKGIFFQQRIGERGRSIRFDPYCLKQAVAKLVDNAIKFTNRGGVTVTLERDEKRSLRLVVEDTGIGIGPRYLSHGLFQAFSQEDPGANRRFEGSGIGLAVAKRLLQMNGASLSVRSEKGKGSTFTVSFPPELEVAEVASTDCFEETDDRCPPAGDSGPSVI